MKKEKKVYSLITKEVLNIVTSLLLVVAIILKLINPQNAILQLTIKILVYAFLISYICINLFRCFVKFDIEDEAAIEHYHRAKRKIFDFLWGFCSGFGASGVIVILIAESIGSEIVEKLSFTISFWHFVTISYWLFLLVYYLIQLAISTCFIYFEKREA